MESGLDVGNVGKKEAQDVGVLLGLLELGEGRVVLGVVEAFHLGEAGPRRLVALDGSGGRDQLGVGFALLRLFGLVGRCHQLREQ